MATTVAIVNELIKWYLSTSPERRLSGLIQSSPLKLEGDERDRAALRRVYKKLEDIERARNMLLEEFANDHWSTDQLNLFSPSSDQMPEL